MGGSPEGRRKGGLATHARHPEIFEKGRLLGAKKLKMGELKYHFDLETPLTMELAELVGAFIGDGFTNKYGRMCETQFSGHKTLDRTYMTERIVQYIKNLSPDANVLMRDVKNENT